MKILLVEDEPKLAAAIKRGLEQERFVVDVSPTADDGLGQALVEPYDLVILDRMLPGNTDGIGVCRALRDQGRTFPILLLTAKDRVSDRVEGLDAGADDYLVKPFAFDELLARLRALTRRPVALAERTLRFRDVTLDPDTFDVARAGTPIRLSKTEFSLLAFLLRHPSRIVSKETIIQHVWPFDATILPNTVEVYVKYLREKIDKPFDGPPLLETVRGFGYRLGPGLPR